MHVFADCQSVAAQQYEWCPICHLSPFFVPLSSPACSKSTSLYWTCGLEFHRMPSSKSTLVQQRSFTLSCGGSAPLVPPSSPPPLTPPLTPPLQLRQSLQWCMVSELWLLWFLSKYIFSRTGYFCQNIIITKCITCIYSHAQTLLRWKTQPINTKVTWSLHKLMGIYMGDLILGGIL